MRGTVWTNIWVLCATSAGPVQSSANVSSRQPLHSNDKSVQTYNTIQKSEVGRNGMIKNTIKTVLMLNIITI